jgi:hypothetical protein
MLRIYRRTNMRWTFLVLTTVLSFQFLYAKVLVITHAFNRPEFIEWQHACLKKFLLDDYEFVVFNDAVGGKPQRLINTTCARLGIKCYPIPQEVHNHLYPLILPPERFIAHPSNRHADGIKYAFEQLGFHHDGIVALIDSDLFIIRPLSIASLLEGYDIAAVMSPGFDLSQKDHSVHPHRYHIVPGIEYLWPGVVFMKMNQVPNKQDLDFSPGKYPHFQLDTGGHTFFYLQNNPGVRVNKLDQFHYQMNKEYLNVSMDLPHELKVQQLQNLKFNEKEINFLLKRPHGISVEFGYNNHFLHYRGASFEQTGFIGNSQDHVDRKTAWIQEFMKDLL